MGIQNSVYPSRDGRTSLHAVRCLPEGQPRAVLQIAHGVAEYIERYAPLARFLAAHGFVVAGNDHLGHGQSRIPGCAPLYFGPRGSWNTVVEDLFTLNRQLRQDYPGLPLFLLGHSMGSFLARTYLIRHPGTVDGAIIMGTGQQPAPIVLGGIAATELECLRLGEEKISPLVHNLAFGAYNRPFRPNRTAFDWISADEATVDAYIADPLCGGTASVGLFREMLRGIRYISRRENLAKMDMATPLLLVSGQLDPVGDLGKGTERAAALLRSAGVERLELKLYPNARHEILIDHCRDTVHPDLIQWMEQVMKGAFPAT